MIYQYTYKMDIGWITIVEVDGCISQIYHSKSNQDAGKYPAFDIKETSLILDAKTQLEEYLAGERKIFNLPLSPKGTSFQQSVWKELSRIEYGKRVSYKEIGSSIGNPNGARAVGNANNKNPIMIVIPCHRVVGSNGNLVGYAGGLELKEYLLELEGKY